MTRTRLHAVRADPVQAVSQPHCATGAAEPIVLVHATHTTCRPATAVVVCWNPLGLGPADGCLQATDRCGSTAGGCSPAPSWPRPAWPGQHRGNAGHGAVVPPGRTPQHWAVTTPSVAPCGTPGARPCYGHAWQSPTGGTETHMSDRTQRHGALPGATHGEVQLFEIRF